MKNEIGLKGIYRFLGKLIARLFNRYFGVFNPNIITIAGFIIYIIAVGIFVVYSRKPTNDIGLYIFITGTQLSLILDFTDGSYARMVNRTSYYGRILDSFFGTVEIIILFGLGYFIAEALTEKWIVVGLVLIYTLDQRIKLILFSQKRQNSNVQRGEASDNSPARWSYILRILVGFNIAHFFLYTSLWFLFDFIYFLFVLYITGLYSVYSRAKLLLRRCPIENLVVRR